MPSTIIEESFVENNLKDGTVFEVGCGPAKLARRLAEIRDVIAMDIKPLDPTLHQPERFTFVEGDVVDADIQSKFDNVIALSVFEHCGLECLQQKCINAHYHLEVAKKLEEAIDDGGRLILTMPFGNNEIFFVDKDGNNGTLEEIGKPEWGFWASNLDRIKGVFKNLKCIKAIAYKVINRDDYFNPASWVETPLESYSEFNNKKRAILCVAFEKEKVCS